MHYKVIYYLGWLWGTQNYYSSWRKCTAFHSSIKWEYDLMRLKKNIAQKCLNNLSVWLNYSNSQKIMYKTCHIKIQWNKNCESFIWLSLQYNVFWYFSSIVVLLVLLLYLLGHKMSSKDPFTVSWPSYVTCYLLVNQHTFTSTPFSQSFLKHLFTSIHFAIWSFPACLCFS